jgi:branched-chain amino acid transport system ATP-binding protein
VAEGRVRDHLAEGRGDGHPARPQAGLGLSAALEVRGLDVAYGGLAALAGVTLHVGAGELVALVGANGAGKSTLLRSVAGLVRPGAGAIRWRGEELGAVPADGVVERGIALVAEGRRLFGRMTVEENLELGAYPARARGRRRATLEEMYELFPRLRERRRQLAGSLSGGEQQMLAIARALMARPALLMLDEPSLGLAPQMVDLVFAALARIHRAGLTLLLVEQNVHVALGLAGRGYLLESGRIVGEGGGRELLNDPGVRRAYLGPLAGT